MHAQGGLVIVGVLTQNNDLRNSIRDQVDDYDVVGFRSIDLIKPVFSILVVDIEALDDPENIQFNLSRLRKKIQNIPVLLMVKSADSMSVNTEWFYHDFVFFPLRKGELLLRIRNLVTRYSEEKDDDVIRVGSIAINISEYTVYRNEERIDFTYKEFELLRHLLQNKGQTFSRKELLNRIWGVEYIGGTRTVDVHVRRLRCKLGDDFNSIIETVRNVGYRCIV